MVVRLLSLGAGLLFWEFYARTQGNPLTIVPPTDVVPALATLLTEARFQGAFVETLRPFAIGLALALGTGVPGGLLVGRSRLISGATMPYLNFLNALPISALVPLLVIGLGLGMNSRVSVVYLFAIVEITLNSAAGVRYVRQELIEMAQSFGAGRVRVFTRIVLPASLPGIMAGVRLGTGRAVVGMVIAELLLVSIGVGRLLNLFSGRWETANLYATVLALALLGLMLLEIVRRLERKLLHWRLADVNR